MLLGVTFTKFNASKTNYCFCDTIIFIWILLITSLNTFVIEKFKNNKIINGYFIFFAILHLKFLFSILQTHLILQFELNFWFLMVKFWKRGEFINDKFSMIYPKIILFFKKTHVHHLLRLRLFQINYRF